MAHFQSVLFIIISNNLKNMLQEKTTSKLKTNKLVWLRLSASE